MVEDKDLCCELLALIASDPDDESLMRGLLAGLDDRPDLAVAGMVSLREPFATVVSLSDRTREALGTGEEEALEEALVALLEQGPLTFEEDRVLEVAGRRLLCRWVRSGVGLSEAPLGAVFFDGETAPCSQVVDFVRIGLSRARLRRNLSTTASCLELLNSIHARFLAGEEDAGETSSILARLRQIFRYDLAGLALASDGGWHLTLRYPAGVARGFVDECRRLLVTVLGRDHGVDADEISVSLVEEENALSGFRGSEKVGSYVLLPLMLTAPGPPLGILAFFSAAANVFAAEHVRLLALLCPGLTGALLDRAELAELRESNVELVRRRGEMEAQLEMAHDIQEHLLPKEPPSLEGVAIGQLYRQARQVGGDLFAYRVGAGRLGVVMGDVSGKGVGAGLLMGFVLGSLHALWRTVESPRAILEALNRTLLGNTDEYRFVTCVYADLDVASGVLHYSSAGHEPVFLVRDGTIGELRTEGIPLGIQADFRFEDAAFDLVPGDTLFFFTDGVYDVCNSMGERFGQAKLRSLVEASAHLDPVALVDAVFRQAASFAEQGKMNDDATIVAIRYLGPALARTML